MQHLRLPFGNFDPVIDDSIDSLRQKIAVAVPGEFDMEVMPGHSSFLHAASSVKFGKLALTALATTPIWIDRKSATKQTIVIPFAGDMEVLAKGQTFAGCAGKTGLFFSGGPRRGLMNNHLSEILVEIDSQYLLDVASAMVSPDRVIAPKVLNLDQDRELPLFLHGISFDSLFRSHCRTVDSMRHQPQALAMLGIDNSFYRNFVALLAPELVFDQASGKSGTQARQADVLDTVCDYIQAHLAHPLTLTTLEQISGLNARALQYAFKRRFGCSPMAWVRQERLVLARDLLSTPEADSNVIKVAFAAGFNHLGKFSQDYRKRFGESPSATHKRAISR